jgi:ABC-2 type transport system permease protein
LIGVKAQLAAGVADWPTFLQVLLLGTAIAGGILFSFVTAWVFGREFADRTAKEWLALPVARETMVAAKFVLIAMWVVGLSLPVLGAAVILGWATDIPGWSPDALMSACVAYAGIVILSLMLMPFVALLASAGRGYLAPLAWAFLTLALAQIAIVLGWGAWFPWAVPAMLADPAAAQGEGALLRSVGIVVLACVAGLAATFVWWRSADQAG